MKQNKKEWDIIFLWIIIAAVMLTMFYNFINWITQLI